MTFQRQCFQARKTIGTHGIDLFVSKKILRQCSKTIFVVADGGGGQIQHSFQFCPRGQHGGQVEAGGGSGGRSGGTFVSLFPHHQIKRMYLSKTWRRGNGIQQTIQHNVSIPSKRKTNMGKKSQKSQKSTY